MQEALEADIPRMLDIMYAAFHDDPWDRIMFPQVPPPESRTASTKRWRHEISGDPHVTVLKVVDTDKGNEIIAFARWHIYRDKRPESEWKSVAPRDWDEGTNVEAANAFFGAIREKRQKVMKGDPHCCRINIQCPLASSCLLTYDILNRSQYAGCRPQAST